MTVQLTREQLAKVLRCAVIAEADDECTRPCNDTCPNFVEEWGIEYLPETMLQSADMLEDDAKLIAEMGKVDAKLAWENGALIAQAPKWISVKDRLPEKTGLYIVCTAKKSVYTAKYCLTKCRGSWQKNPETHISYWMPLPEPQKEE